MTLFWLCISFTGKQLYSFNAETFIWWFSIIRDFSAEPSSFTPKLNAGEHIFNLANTYKTILVAFYNHFKFQIHFSKPHFCLEKQ